MDFYEEREKERKKKKECRWCIKGPMSTRVIHEEREGWDESTNEGGGATNVCNTHVNSFLHSFSKTSSYLQDPCIITKKNPFWNYKLAPQVKLLKIWIQG
jgi:hypothetical protein